MIGDRTIPWPSRTATIVLGTVLLVALGGCVSLTVDITVGPDGDLEETYHELEIDDEVYDFIEADVREDGYDDVEDWLVEQIAGDVEGYGSIESDHETDGDTHTVWVSLTEVPNEELDQIEVTVDDDADTVEFEHPNAIGLSEDEREGMDEEAAQIEFSYTVTMPGDIEDHNGDEVDDDTVTWEADGSEDPRDVYVRSSVDDDSLPGFGPAGAIVGALAAGSLIALGRRMGG